MDALQKLQTLGPAAGFEPAEEVNPTGTLMEPPSFHGLEELAGCVHYAAMPNGRRIPLLKTLLTSACERDCTYCPFRAGRDFQRMTFTPDELAKLFLELNRRRLVEGLFVSSGVAGGGPRTQDRLLATTELLRVRYNFKGYIHVKIMPGAERAQVEAAMGWADRVSINLEAPNDARLAKLAPHKIFTEELLQRLRWMQEIRQEKGGRQPSTTTQFVVGAAGESDLELLTTTEYLHRQVGLARAYFSGFNPVSDTPLADLPPSPPLREHRLYQASFLLRDYGFEVEELPFALSGNLPLDEDPKMCWARLNLTERPVELNLAGREQLLRVPGIGVKGAEQILAARRRGLLRDLSTLRRLGIAADRAAPFILLDGRQPARQLRLWPLS